MSEPGEFVDAALQREGSWYRAEDDQQRLGSSLRFYGASIGAVRGTIRDAQKRYPGLGHNEVTALASELWAEPVYERRLAAIVLLQSNRALLLGSDLTRLEGFVRTAGLRALVDPLAIEVIGPLADGLAAPHGARAFLALERWTRESDPWLRRAALLAAQRALASGGGDWPRFSRQAVSALAVDGEHPGEPLVQEAVDQVLAAVQKTRPELQLPTL